LPFPGASIEKDFAWAPQHPIVDAIEAYQPGPYDPPSYDMAGSLYAVHPDQGFFQLSEPGSIAVAENGRLSFAPGPAGKVRSLIIDPAQKEKILKAYTELASAKPAVPQQRVRPPQKAAEVPKPPAAPAKPD
jgi:hypothetical protein